ncbi:ATP-binding protein [Paenibacillus sp. ACRSA]|uniref:ATP-binding protein n=1 Tax=Paenibacillus sp. ACRSA TaxID=2918211 RepID=UPI001EF51970|nr:ATP-binding protein [Paenibacillus sp. ACRSA]MCG7377380.1 ATP-binding protein [Paenibacillus sp. ACRSA]
MEQAQYTEQVIPDYQDNPLIEALPEINSEEAALKALLTMPNFDQRERDLSAIHRMHCIPRLFKYFLPLQKHLDLERDIGLVIRQSYCSRNPLKGDYVKRAQRGYRELKEGKYQYHLDDKMPSLGFTIIGIPGSGKSKSLERIIGLYPRVIEHSFYKQQHLIMFQIPMLTLQTPHDGASLKSLCLNFFEKVDKTLGGRTTYLQKFGLSGNPSTEKMLIQMEQIVNNHGIGLLVIDEVQYLRRAKDGARKILNFFVSMVNRLNVPILFVGNYEAVNILEGQFKMQRRGTGLGTAEWNRLKSTDPEDWEDFGDILTGLWKYQWTHETVELTEEFKAVMYDETQGILDLIVKLFIISQIYAIGSGEEKLSVKLIRKVAKQNFKPLQEAIHALRIGNEDLLSKYDDLLPLDVQEFIRKNQPKLDKGVRAQLIKEANMISAEEEGLPFTDQIIRRLLSVYKDMDAKQAQTYAENVHGYFVSSNKPLDVEAGLREAKKMVHEERGESGMEESNSKVTKEKANEKRAKEIVSIEEFEENGLFQDPLIPDNT